MNHNEPNLGEQALDKVAEIAIQNQLDEVEQVNVNVHADATELVQGKVKSADVVGEGMVMKQDLRVEAIEISTDTMAIDPLKAVLGQIELTQPTNARAQILLTEKDLNRALDSNYLRSKLKRLEIEVEGKVLSLELQRIKLQIPDSGKIAFDAHILLLETNETKQFSAIVKPFLKENGYRIGLEIISAEGQGLSLEFITALFKKVIELLDLRNFELEGMTLQLKDLDVREGKMLLRAKTRIEKLPTT